MISDHPPVQPIRRAAIVAEARLWLGTPYHHQASALGVGADCVGLVRGILRTVLRVDPDSPPVYTRDWAEASGRETLLDAARAHLTEIEPADTRPGDILVFRFRPHTVAKHAAVLTSPQTMIHAIEGAAVSEARFNGWWRRRVAGAFAIPGIID